MRILLMVVSCAILFANFSAAQERDKGLFSSYKKGFWEKIVAGIKKFESKKSPEHKNFKVDHSGRNYPTNIDKYKTFWHNPPISQGNTGTCWCFSTTSFFESEIYRISGKKVKLSEMYTVYWETIEKARRFVRKRGKSLFDEGSEGNAVPRMWKKYGIVPAKAYTAMKPGQKFHNHEPMFAEMKKYLASLKKSNAWNEERVLETIKAIMHHYIGCPPKYITIDGKKITPLQYLASLPIDLDDYVDFMSLMQHPYYKKAEYKVPDNWWHSKEYVNIPLQDFVWVLRNATQHGFSVLTGGDISEPGYDCWQEVAVVPSFDIPSAYIDQYARQFRFCNRTTTDDHGIHCIGWQKINGVNWYLIKDSSSGARNGKHHGYLFYHEDYIKLKMMNIMVHKDAAGKIWKKYLTLQAKK